MREMTPYEILYGIYLVHKPDVPTNTAPSGIRFDFNDGARVFLPKGEWHIAIEDKETGNILYEQDSSGGLIQSHIRYYLKFGIKVWRKGETSPIWEHTVNLKGQKIQILFPLVPIGDVIAWLPAALAFVRKHSCRAELIMSEGISDLFRQQYPEIIFTDPRKERPKFSEPYATYHLGIHYFVDKSYNSMYSPFDYRMFPLHFQAASILGMNIPFVPPNIKKGSHRIVPERYVAIACKSTKKGKNWNNPNGWSHIVAYLHRMGYRVICIDKNAVQDGEGIPPGAENFTGDRPLSERAAIIEHCDFFIGLDTGLSWMAWCLGRPVIIIGGYTLPFHLFGSPYHTMTQYACCGCFHDIRFSIRDELSDYYSCPRHKGTSREFECSRLITAKQVIIQINRLMTEHRLSKPGGGC